MYYIVFVLYVLAIMIEIYSSIDSTEDMLDMFVPCSIPTRISQRAVNVCNRGKQSFRNLQPVSRIDEIRTITNKSVKCNKTEKSLNHRNFIPVKLTDYIIKSDCAKLASINCQSMNNKSRLHC